MAYHNIKSDKKPGIHYPFSRYLLKKTTGGVKLSPSLFRIKNISIYPVTNFYSRLGNCIYLPNVKPVTFIHINIVQGNNFPKQHDALNTVFRLFQSYADISNIFEKINYDGQNFQAFTQILCKCLKNLRKVFKYSVTLEAVIRRCTIKKRF